MSPRSVDITALVRVFSLSGATSWTLSLAMMICCSRIGLLVAGEGRPVDLILASDQRRELGDQVLVQLAFEGDDQVRQLLEIGPAPGREFRMFGRYVDVAIGAQEAECEPFLLLAAEPALPELRHQVHRQVVGQPVVA